MKIRRNRKNGLQSHLLWDFFSNQDIPPTMVQNTPAIASIKITVFFLPNLEKGEKWGHKMGVFMLTGIQGVGEGG